jgi:transcriptional regulator with XRE-family HTH domain
MDASFNAHVRECLTHTNVLQANATVTTVKTFASRLKYAREQIAGLSQVELAKKAGVSPGSIGNYESGTREMPRDILGLSAALGVNPIWLQEGKLPISQESLTRPAQPLSLSDARLSSPVIEWGVLTMKTLPKAFKVAAPDDSMSPRLKQGQLAEFETGLEHRPGDGVLVRDADGECHIRRCRKARDGWEAYAENSEVYPALPIGPAGVEVLAVLVGVHARWG